MWRMNSFLSYLIFFCLIRYAVVKVEKCEVGELHFQCGPLNFSVRAPSHEDRAHQMLNIRCNICFRFLNLYLCWPSGATSHCRQFFCTEVVIWSYTTVHVAFRLPDTVHFYELEGTGMLFASNQMCRLAGHSLASHGTLTTADTSEISQITPLMTLSVAESLACWTQAQKGLGSDRSRDAVR